MRDEFNAKLAIEHEPVYALNEILALKNMAALKKLASGLGVKGYSSMNKPELIQLLAAALTDEKRMADVLTLVNDGEWELLQKAASCRELADADESAPDPLFLMGIGYLESFSHNNSLTYVVPEEIRLALKNLMQSGYGDEWAHITMLNKYALAATSLYGVIALDEFVELFNSHNERKTDVDEVCSVLMRFIALNAGYCFWDEFIVNAGFEENDFKDVKRLTDTAASKPRYLPDREEFLRYADDSYYEVTPQMAALKEYILTTLHNDPADVDVMLGEIHRLCSAEAKMQPIMDVFNRRGINFDSSEQANELTQLIVGVMNNTRLWFNNGHSPDELHEKLEKPKLKQPPVQPGQPYRSHKIGRNEPCPCGSGKKYKKCCGW